MNNILVVKNLHKEFNTKSGLIEAISNVSFKIVKGEIVAIVGPSGCGKSTLLNIIAGIDKQSSGTCLFDKDVPKIAYMLQTDALLPWQTVLDNALLGLTIRKELTPNKKEKTKTLLKEYGLKDFIDKKANLLSGGMKQRVALIRSLAIEPDILLLDEPFCALDYCTRITITKDVRKIIKELNTTAIIITHDINEALTMADRIIVLTDRPSTVKNIYEVNKNDDIYNSIWEDLNESV